MIMEESDYLSHYGILRLSGRYPWGSGGNVPQRSKSFLDYVQNMKNQGLSEKDIAQGVGMTVGQLRETKTVAIAEDRAATVGEAVKYKAKGMSTNAIATRMGVPEATVRNYLKNPDKYTESTLKNTVDTLRMEVDSKGFLDIGRGASNYMGISDQKLSAAVSILKDEGFVVSNPKVKNAGDKFTKMKVLSQPDTTFGDVLTAVKNDKVRTINVASEDLGETFLGMLPPKAVDPSRVSVNYAEDGGTAADGVMYIRPGVDDLSLGGKSYAQVRIQVGPGHYLKGMAIYKDGLPEGTDILFNTNKSKEQAPDKLDALKPLKDDADNPFGTQIKRQIFKTNADGTREVTSAVNLVNEEGDWGGWSNSIASQVLSKQPPKLAKQQLDMAFESRHSELKDILELTNPTVKKALLEDYARTLDAQAVSLKAHALPRQRWQVLLPTPDSNPGEIYAPNYENGEVVALVRYPHGGKFEIPQLVVNNRNPKAKAMLGSAKDAVGIHPSVADILSGADFDGDTVLVIPNNKKDIQTAKPIERLQNFDAKREYARQPGMKEMGKTLTQTEMGNISNLITDMQIKNASTEEVTRAVRHSMVVIDAEKHGLDYTRSYRDHGIKALKQKYQANEGGGTGASTIVSRAGSDARIPQRRPSYVSEGGAIDVSTGKRNFTPTGRTRPDGTPKMQKEKLLSVTDDAFDLSSGTRVETVYAKHSNRMKELANVARRELVNTPRLKRSPQAAKTYEAEVASLKKKLDVVQRNAPLERRAQVIANQTVSAKKQSNPNMDPATEKKMRAQAETAARARMGASGKAAAITFTTSEWEAIQAGAISENALSQMLQKADKDQVRELATPRARKLMSSAKTSRAKTMLSSGYTRAEVAKQLGVSLTTLDEATV